MLISERAGRAPACGYQLTDGPSELHTCARRVDTKTWKSTRGFGHTLSKFFSHGPSLVMVRCTQEQGLRRLLQNTFSSTVSPEATPGGGDRLPPQRSNTYCGGCAPARTVMQILGLADSLGVPSHCDARHNKQFRLSSTGRTRITGRAMFKSFLNLHLVWA